MGFFEAEWPADERDIITVEELLFDVRALIRIQGVFGITSYIDSV